MAINEIVGWKTPKFHQASECYVSLSAFDPERRKFRVKKFMLDHIKGKRNQREYGEALIKRLTEKLMQGWNPWVVMRMQKTDHEVRIPISKMFGGKAATMIQENKTTTGKLFILPCNARCNLVLKRVLKRFNIHRHITFHCARHTCATVLLSKGVSLPIIQHILGHQSIKTTQVYSAVKDSTINKEIRRAFR